MARELSSSLVSVREREIIINQYQSGYSLEFIANIHNLKVSTIKTYIRRFNKTDSILTEYENKKLAYYPEPVPRSKILDDDDINDFIEDEIHKDATKTLHKYCEDIYNKFEIYVSPSTISRTLNKAGYKYKKISRIALEKNEMEEMEFWKVYDSLVIDPEQCCFMDESYRSDITANHTYGRGIGYVCILYIYPILNYPIQTILYKLSYTYNILYKYYINI